MKAKAIEWKLVWVAHNPGHLVAEEHAVSEGNKLSRVVRSRYFATVRSAAGAYGLVHEDMGFYVTQGKFDDLRDFLTLDEAKIYVQSIYELEKQ